MLYRASLAAGIAAAILAAAPVAHAQDVAYTGSLQFASGDYIFAQRTSSMLLFSGLSAKSGPVRVSASVPLIYQSTPWISYSGGVMIPSGGPEHGAVGGRMGMGHGNLAGGAEIELADTVGVAEVGLGDVTFHTELEVLGISASRPSLRLTAGAKLPIADVDRGFGTGEWDYAVGLSMSQAIGRAMIFADAAYWVLGDLPDLELRDPLAYALALGHPLGERLGLLVSFSGYTTIIEGTDPPAQVALGLSYLIADDRGLLGSASFGLSQSSPDFSLSVGWRVGL